MVYLATLYICFLKYFCLVSISEWNTLFMAFDSFEIQHRRIFVRWNQSWLSSWTKGMDLRRQKMWFIQWQNLANIGNVQNNLESWSELFTIVQYFSAFTETKMNLQVHKATVHWLKIWWGIWKSLSNCLTISYFRYGHPKSVNSCFMK